MSTTFPRVLSLTLFGLSQVLATALPGINIPPVLPALPALPAPTDYIIAARDGNSQVWQRTTYELSPDGKIIPKLHSYNELATGLNYKNALGQWVPAKEEITILPDGTAAARQGQHQAYFPADIYNGAIKLVTPDGLILLSQPAALSYDDGSNTVLIAILTNSIGYLSSPNQVIYPHAFAGVDADLRYTYTRDGFEQDVVLRARPEYPDQFGLNPQTTRIQVLTEFFDPPTPKISLQHVVRGALTLANQQCDFGRLSFGNGMAFSLSENAPKVSVDKQWIQSGGRHFLMEEVPTAEIAAELENLPAATSSSGMATVFYKSKQLQMPPPHPFKSIPGKAAIHLAKAGSPRKGYVLDYQSLNNSLTNYTFKSDTTYYISGAVNLYGTNTFEGGTVLKYATNASVNLQTGSGINWLSDSYRPIVFTAKDDNTIGESIGGSTGNPSGYYANPALTISDGLFPASGMYSNFRISHAQCGLILGNTTYPGFMMGDGQILKCNNGVKIISAQYGYTLQNMLFSQINTGLCYNVSIVQMKIQNTTFDSMGAIVNGAAVGGNIGNLLCTNDIFANITNIVYGASINTKGQNNGFYNNNFTDFGGNQINSSAAPFKSAGGGNYYLNPNSLFRNAGISNISPFLLSDIATRTTYPPIAYTNTTFTNAIVFSPQAQRDTDTPDLGYHYAPLDYTFGGCTANSNLTFTAGTAVGWFRTTSGWQYAGFGIYLKDQQIAEFKGTATSPCYWVRLNTVQENDRTAGYGPGGLEGRADVNNPISKSPEVRFNFTKAYMMATEPGGYLRDDWGYLVLRAQNCEFGAGNVAGYVASLYLTNCLFERTYVAIVSGVTGNAVAVMNGTIRGEVTSPIRAK